MEVFESNSIYSIIVNMYNHKTNEIFFIEDIPLYNTKQFSLKEFRWVCDDKKWILKINGHFFDEVVKCCLPDLFNINDIILIKNTLMTNHGRKNMFHLVKKSGIGKKLYMFRAFI